jgi:hypothetical protein
MNRKDAELSPPGFIRLDKSEELQALPDLFHCADPGKDSGEETGRQVCRAPYHRQPETGFLLVS